MGGGSKTSSVTIPQWLEDAARSNIARAEDVSRIGYTPYYGPDVAGLTPANMASVRGTASMASAFGAPSYDATAGMPTAGNYDGMSAYSAGPMYDAALAELKRRDPNMYAKLAAPFASQLASATSSGVASALAGLTNATPRVGSDRDVSFGSQYGAGNTASGNGYTGLRDMLNGGGPGQSGSTFSGGGRVSAVANALGTKPWGSK